MQANESSVSQGMNLIKSQDWLKIRPILFARTAYSISLQLQVYICWMMLYDETIAKCLHAPLKRMALSNNVS